MAAIHASQAAHAERVAKKAAQKEAKQQAAKEAVAVAEAAAAQAAETVGQLQEEAAQAREQAEQVAEARQAALEAGTATEAELLAMQAEAEKVAQRMRELEEKLTAAEAARQAALEEAAKAAKEAEEASNMSRVGSESGLPKVRCRPRRPWIASLSAAAACSPLWGGEGGEVVRDCAWLGRGAATLRTPTTRTPTFLLGWPLTRVPPISASCFPPSLSPTLVCLGLRPVSCCAGGRVGL